MKIAILIHLLMVLTAHTAAAAPALVELFTSTTCPKCPPVERRVADLQAEGHLFALVYHVDYGKSWLRSDKDATEDNYKRQSRYQRAFGHNHVYTPMLVVGGREAGRDVLQPPENHHMPVAMSLQQQPDGQLHLHIAETENAPHSEVILITFTAENKRTGRHHTVRTIETLTHWQGSALNMSLGRPQTPVAVLVQRAEEGPVLGWAKSL